MIRTYWLIAVRNMRKHSLFSFINILCLSLGITFSLLIGVYVFKEKNVNADLRSANNQITGKE